MQQNYISQLKHTIFFLEFSMILWILEREKILKFYLAKGINRLLYRVVGTVFYVVRTATQAVSIDTGRSWYHCTEWPTLVETSVIHLCSLYISVTAAWSSYFSWEWLNKIWHQLWQENLRPRNILAPISFWYSKLGYVFWLYSSVYIDILHEK
jgi:hypothetical protein